MATRKSTKGRKALRRVPPFAANAAPGAYVGEIRIFATPTLPDQTWLPCDGRLYNIKDYPQLASVIGNLWGSDTKDKFRVPDFRGMFLRGWNNGAAADPDANNRQLPTGAPGVKTDVVGSYQPDSVGPHTHTTNARTCWGDKWADPPGWGLDNGNSQGSRGLDTAAMTTKETRPKNAYVQYAIKARP